MAGEELKTPGTNGLSTGNPLYNRGIPRLTPSEYTPVKEEKDYDLLYVLAVAVLSVVLSYLIFVPIILLLVL